MTALPKNDAVTGHAKIHVDDRSGTAEVGATLFDFAESLGITVPTSCHKQGKCRECLLEIESGAELLTAPAPQESHLSGQFRLACRTHISGPGEIRCHTLRRGSLRIETEAVRLHEKPHHLHPAVSHDDAHIYMDGEPIADYKGSVYGLAIDIGTTTVVLRLYNLETGERIATNSFENPQRFGGSDIMARIRFDGEHRGRLLQRTLLGYLSRAILELRADPSTIYEAVVAANPTMRDLFFGLDVQTIGAIPYRSMTEAAFREGNVSTTSISRSALRLRLPLDHKARIYGLPLIASHVGADAAACLLATGIADHDEICAIMDIGTNTEVILGNRELLMAASCPAGPAFEGGGVRFGMPALDHAIERVKITEDGSLQISVINDGVPVGICGSGLVDLLAELRRTERMNEQGRFTDEHSEILVDRSITLNESDVNELAQAKGANAAGLRTIADVYGISLHRIDRLYLAGGFSKHIDVEAAKRIGLIPDLPSDRIVKIGNAALEGASMALLSIDERRKIEELVKRVQHVRLETHPHFFDFFVEGCQFAPFGSGV